jgi:phosphopantetheinyl transferase
MAHVMTLYCVMVGSATTHERPLLWAMVAIDAPMPRDLFELMVTPDRSGSGERSETRHRLGRALALHLLGRATSGLWTIGTTEGGKPVAEGGGVERHISISHTGSFVAAAVSAIGPIGIDIERQDAARDVVRLATAAFGRAEAKMVEIQGVMAFYRIWTLREAISKATGEGLSQAVDRIDRVPAQMPDGVWAVSRDNWLIAHDVLDDEISLAIAVQPHSALTTATMRDTRISSSRVSVVR